MNSNKGLYAVGFILGLSGLLVVGVTVGQHQVERKIKTQLNRQIAKHSDRVTITYRNVKANFFSRNVAVNDITVTPLTDNPKDLTLKIDRFELSDLDNETIVHMAMDSGKPRLPKTMRLGVIGLHLTADLLGEKASAALSEYNYSELNMSLAMGLQFDRENRKMRFDDIGLQIADLGKLSTTWDFSQVTLPSDDQLSDPQALKDLSSHWKEVALHYADIKYTDMGLLARLDTKLKNQGKPSLAQGAEQLAQMMGRTPAKLSFLNDAVPKLKDFLTNGGAIALKAAPVKDQTLVELANPMALMDPNAFATQIGLSIDVSH